MEDRENRLRNFIDRDPDRDWFGSDITYLLSIIDSFRASQKELVEAVERVSSAMRDFDQQDLVDTDGIVDGHIMDKYGIADITVGDICRLKQGIEKIKEKE